MSKLIPVYGTALKEYVSFKLGLAGPGEYQLLTEDNIRATLRPKTCTEGRPGVIRLDGTGFDHSDVTMIIIDDFHQMYRTYGVKLIAMLYICGQSVGNYYIFDNIESLGLILPTKSTAPSRYTRTSWV